MATRLVQEGLVDKLSAALFIPQQDIDPSKPTSAAGIDSLVAVKVKYWFLKEIRAEVAVFNILVNMSISSLCEFALSTSPFEKALKSNLPRIHDEDRTSLETCMYTAIGNVRQAKLLSRNGSHSSIVSVCRHGVAQETA